MLKIFLKNKLKFVGVIILGLGLVFSTSILTLAEENKTQAVKTQVQNPDKEKLLLDKQREIDSYVFEQHAKDIEKRGFKVTNTGQINGYVEIGITPFNKENADYLYSLFGKDLVKVVEGQQAQLMGNTAPTTIAQKEEGSNTFSPNSLFYIVILAIAAGGAFFIIKKRKTI